MFNYIVDDVCVKVEKVCCCVVDEKLISLDVIYIDFKLGE